MTPLENCIPPIPPGSPLLTEAHLPPGPPFLLGAPLHPMAPLLPGAPLPIDRFWNGDGDVVPPPLTVAGIRDIGAASDDVDPISTSYTAAANQAANRLREVCECEFNCKDAGGNVIPVVAKVKMYEDHLRSGSFQKEMTEVNMTLLEFKEHFIKCTKKYLIHHFHDVMSSQARRNLYEKMRTDSRLHRTGILASD
jgi:hypothetical protein